MGQFSVETYSGPGSLLSDNQQSGSLEQQIPYRLPVSRHSCMLDAVISGDGGQESIERFDARHLIALCPIVARDSIAGGGS